MSESGAPKKLLTVGDVAEQLSLSVSMVYKLVGQRRIETTRIGKGAVRFTQAQIDEFIRSNAVPAVPAVADDN